MAVSREGRAESQAGNAVRDLISREQRAVAPPAPTLVQQKFSGLKQLGAHTPHAWDLTLAVPLP